MNTKALEAEFVKLIEQDTEAALQLITGMFVGLTLEYMRRRGHEPSGDITIKGGSQRDITIHAEKPKASPLMRACGVTDESEALARAARDAAVRESYGNVTHGG